MKNNTIVQVDSFLSRLNPELWLQLRLEKTRGKNKKSLSCSYLINLIIYLETNKIWNKNKLTSIKVANNKNHSNTGLYWLQIKFW